ncbi:MAG: prefoldin subunit [Candidatus Poseidoniaceae archaeon]|jgi:chaperonin cofactor prefoldin|nr:prefoldin subunit [Candidatus Poseidoniaceae archaeon]
MEQAQALQMVVAEVQNARQQVAQINAQVRELEGTIAAVDSQPEDLALHRQMGAVLVEVEDREQLKLDLESTLEQLKEALKTISAKEAELISTYDQLKAALEG